MSAKSGNALVGWGVVRVSPWHFAGLFKSRGAAEVRLAQLGGGYVVRYGERDAGTDTFVAVPTGPAAPIRGSIFEPAEDPEKEPGPKD